ncbi:MAG: phosphatidylinositol-specific phospholipase C [Lachnospiraceae bacterium]|nr:phosphatidylinositol-specific phospholipase C [Lachnospiraceae bacterium]
MRETKKRLALFMIIAMALALTVPNKMTVNAAETTTGSNWMAGVDGEKTLSNITIPGTHDSCTQHVPLGFIFQCQNEDISTQLEDGCRYLDIRAAISEKDNEPALVMVHNFAKCKKGPWPWSKKLYLNEVVDDVYAFLEQNPTETVIFNVKAENGDDDISTLQQLLYEKIDENGDKWYTANEIPTLNQVRGKIVLATRFEDKVGVGESRRGLNFAWEGQGGKDIVEEPAVVSAINDDANLWVQDRYKYSTEDKINAVVEVLDNCQTNENTFSINFTSTSGTKYVGHPKKYAGEINRYLKGYDWQQDANYGIVVVDFMDADLAGCIYSTN